MPSVFPCEEYDKKPHPEVRSWADAAAGTITAWLTEVADQEVRTTWPFGKRT